MEKTNKTSHSTSAQGGEQSRATPRNGSTSSPRDVLMHLFVMLGLYVSAGAFLALLFGLINSYLPDALNPYASYASSLRWSLAVLVVVFPAYVWGSWFIFKDNALNPWKKELRIRKWLLYITIFAAASLLMGDVVSLIFNFLEGELSSKFLLKTLAVAVVGVVVLGYYLYELRRRAEEFSPKMRVFVIAAIVLVATAVVFGFFTVGSPFRQRLAKFDEEKIGHLGTIQWQIVYFWQNKQRLPQSLDELIDTISGFVPPRDPQSGTSYEYRVTGEHSFELCANFNLSSKDVAGALRALPQSPAFPAPNQNWEHGSGRTCFERTIDPELYPPQSKSKP
jgi:hypothetical protein